jgi:hypothetical protein
LFFAFGQRPALLRSQLEGHAIRKNSNYKALCALLDGPEHHVAKLQHGVIQQPTGLR